MVKAMARLGQICDVRPRSPRGEYYSKNDESEDEHSQLAQMAQQVLAMSSAAWHCLSLKTHLRQRVSMHLVTDEVGSP